LFDEAHAAICMYSISGGP